MARSNVIVANQVLTGTGADAAARPSIAFGDTDTGFYEPVDDKVTVTLAGVDRFHFSGSAFTQADGTPYITSATVGANAVGNAELSGQILWSKLANSVQGRVLYVNSQSQVSGLAVGTAGQVLSTNGAGSDPSWIAQTAAGITRRYVFSGQGAANGSAWIGAHQIPSGTLTSGQCIFLFGGARGLSSAATLRMSISGTILTHAALALGGTSHAGIIGTIAQTQPSNTTETAIQLNELGTATLATGAGTEAANWIEGTFWISGQIVSGTGASKARVELWY